MPYVAGHASGLLSELMALAREYWFILGPLVAALGWSIRWAAVRLLRTARTVHATWHDQCARLARIDTSLGPNGGKSVVDRLQRIEDGQHSAAAEIAWMRARIDADQRTAADPILELDATGHVTVVNRACEALIDRGAGDVIGRGLIGVVHPEDRDRVVREWLHAVEDHRWSEIALRLLRRDGTAISARMYSEPMRTRTGEVLGWIVRFGA